MTRRMWVTLTLVAVAVGIVAWLVLRDSGVVVALAVCSVYIVLLSVELPLGEWMRLTKIETLIETNKNTSVFLDHPCQLDNGSAKRRHVHFVEVLSRTDTERLSRAYGSVKLTEKLGKDIRHGWEMRVLATIIVVVVYGVFAFARIGSATTTPASAPAGVGFDLGKAAIAAVISLFVMASSMESMMWFRKQNDQL